MASFHLDTALSLTPRWNPQSYVHWGKLIAQLRREALLANLRRTQKNKGKLPSKVSGSPLEWVKVEQESSYGF
jgi:hypothetical protein